MEYTREERLARMALLYSTQQMERLRAAHVMVFGLGGVGSYAAEALCRAGVGKLTLVDADTVAASNVNRQLPALCSTVGLPKADVMAARLADIAPDCIITPVRAFHLPDDPVEIPADAAMVVDAIDTVAAKIDLALTCRTRGIPMVACMGMGNRRDPTQIRIGDLFDTSGCPLCRVLRRELRRRGVKELRCVYSTEEAAKPAQTEGAELRATGRQSPGSVAFVPSVAGLYLAYEAVETLCGGAVAGKGLCPCTPQGLCP